MATADKRERLRRRHIRIRKRLSGTPERPRLCVHRTNGHMIASLVDDVSGRTLLCVTTTSNDFAAAERETKTSAAARLGEIVARKTLDMGFRSVVFDRGGHPYHGRVKALAEKARESGLVF